MTEDNPTPTPDEEPDGTLFAIYDEHELRFLDGTFPTGKAARDAHKATIEGKSTRYKVRKV